MDMNFKNINDVTVSNENFDLRSLLFMFRRRWSILFGFFVVFAVVSYIYMYYFTTPLYQASTMLFVYRSNDTQSTVNNEINVGAQLVNDVSSILKTLPVLEGTIKKLDDKNGLTSLDLSKKIDSSIVKDTRLLKISVTDKSPLEASKIANAISGVVIERFDAIMKSKLNGDEEFISIVEDAIPNLLPINSNRRSAVIGFSLLGLILGLGTILLLEYLNNTIKTQENAEWYLGSNVIAVIPKFQK